MLRKSVFAILAFLLALAWQAPASLADSLLRQLSRDNFALLGAEGGLWSGAGRLAVPDPASGRFVPVMQLRWRWQAAYLLRGQLRWQLTPEGKPPAALAVGFHGPLIEKLELGMPARYALERIPNAFGRAGWHGDLVLSMQDWRCDWQGKCSGEAGLTWLGAASDLFPQRRFGDYDFRAHARQGLTRFELTTLAGEIQLQATGKIAPTWQIEVEGHIVGDPAFVGRLPNIAGRLVTPDGAPGRLRFAFRQ